MKSTINPIQSIDSVLSIFDPSSQLRGMHNLKIKELLRHEQINLSDRLLREILHKLVKDNYLRIEIAEATVGTMQVKDVNYYLLTFEGELFKASGGYSAQAQSIEARKHWEDELLVKGEKNGERLNALTLWLAVGTIFLAFLEVIKLLLKK